MPECYGIDVEIISYFLYKSKERTAVFFLRESRPAVVLPGNRGGESVCRRFPGDLKSSVGPASASRLRAALEGQKGPEARKGMGALKKEILRVELFRPSVRHKDRQIQ